MEQDDRDDWDDRDGDDEPWERGAWPSDGGADGDRGWRGEAQAAWADDAWRGDEHLADWPEWSAGPEYLMWKRAADDE